MCPVANPPPTGPSGSQTDRGANPQGAGPLTGMTDTETTSPLGWFVNSLLQSTGQMTLIIDHMARNASEAPDAEPFDAVLRRLFNEILAKGLAGHPPAHFATAAALLADARDVIADEIYLVEPGEPLDD
jgi:hypothetical protein